MISANKDYLQSFFQGQIRYIVPFYQRAYVWNEENWEPLWENLWQVYSEAGSQVSEHFIGTLILKQRQAQSLGDNSYDLIDGQQRLTTIAILLRAIANESHGDLPDLPKIVEGLLVFGDAYGKQHYRMEHNRLDRPYFEALLGNKDTSPLERRDHKILLAYNYFVSRVKPLSDQELARLKDVILWRVPVISMILSQDDDEQVIFDTINSLGVKLTTAALLKNHVFREPETREMYDSHWQDVFEGDEDQVRFWERPKTAGRIVRTNTEVLLYAYLMMMTQKEIRIERLFKEYKDWLKGKSVSDRVAFLEELKELAGTYFGMPDGEDLSELRFRDHEKRFFYVIDSLNITTAYPLLLFLYRHFDGEERLTQLGILESYLVRRAICRLTTKNYNNLFLSVLQKLDQRRTQGALTSASLYEVLAGYTDETSIFPSDEDVAAAFGTVHLSNQNARTVLFCIALCQHDSGLHDAPNLSPSSYSVEHIMPKAWRSHWSEAGMPDMAQRERDRCVLTLGNLTLVTKRLNSKLKNGPWTAKRETLRQFSSLWMTTQYLDNQPWDEARIHKRGEALAALALKIWKRQGEAD